MAERFASLGNFDLNLLRSLDALLHERGVTRAAARLCLGQPAMSGALARLRVLFGDELLVRTGRTMELTPLAESLAEPVGQLLADIEKTLRLGVRFDPRKDRRTFKVATTDYGAMLIIRPLLQVLATEAPDVGIHVRSTGLADHVALARRGEIDLAIVPEQLAAPDAMLSERLLEDHFVTVAWRENHEVSDPLSVDEFRRLPYLGYRIGSSMSIMDAALREHGLGLEAHTAVESFVVGAQMIRGTRQITFLQHRLAMLYRDSQELRLVDPPVPMPTLTEVMTWHARTAEDPAHTWLRQRISTIAGGMEIPWSV